MNCCPAASKKAKVTRRLVFFDPRTKGSGGLTNVVAERLSITSQFSPFVHLIIIIIKALFKTERPISEVREEDAGINR